MKPTKNRNEKKTDTTVTVEGLGRCKVEKGRCVIVTEQETRLDLSGCGKTFEQAVAALRRNYALGGITKKGATNAR